MACVGVVTWGTATRDARQAYKSMVNYPTGDVHAPDLLTRFVGGLENIAGDGVKRFLLNKHGGLAEHIVFRTRLSCEPHAREYWHGTTYQSLPDIMSVGLRTRPSNSSNANGTTHIAQTKQRRTVRAFAEESGQKRCATHEGIARGGAYAL